MFLGLQCQWHFPFPRTCYSDCVFEQRGVWRSKREKNFFELCQRHPDADDDDDDDDDHHHHHHYYHYYYFYYYRILLVVFQLFLWWDYGCHHFYVIVFTAKRNYVLFIAIAILDRRTSNKTNNLVTWRGEIRVLAEGRQHSTWHQTSSELWHTKRRTSLKWTIPDQPRSFPRWWFQIYFMFTPKPWGNDPFWIFFKWVETTNYSFSLFVCVKMLCWLNFISPSYLALQAGAPTSYKWSSGAPTLRFIF